MISLGDLGLKPSNVSTADIATDDTPTDNEFALVTGSTLARALMHTWSGDRIVTVDSPPGAGKTTLVTELVRHLTHRSELSLVVACPTKRGMYDMAERLVATFGTDEDAPKVVFNHSAMPGPLGTVTSAGSARHVVVRTVASCALKPPPVDVLIVDEAFQSTFAQVYAAAFAAEQILMVGDPGQIGPVNRVPAQFWDKAKVSPAQRAPEGFSQFEDAVRLNLDATYRVGQTTVDIIAPLYDFEFESRRPDRHLLDESGQHVPEIEAVTVPEVGFRADQSLMRAIAAKAVSFIGARCMDTDVDGNPVETTVEEADIAVVVAHNDQAQMVGAYINQLLGRSDSSASEHRIYVGTADRAQGGQWKAVVALDPVVGHAAAGSHQLSSGRLCVMLSRHTHHLTWLHDGTWEGKFTAVASNEDALPDALNDAALCLDVRRRIAGHDLGRTLNVQS